ncbi:MAG: phosphatase PAP2 family protein [Anaerolineae bacterium]
MSGDFRSPGWLARHPVVGTLMFIIGGLIFAVLAYEVRTKGSLLQWDVPLAAQAHATALREPASITEILTFGFFLGKEMTEIIGAILVIYFLYKRLWPELGMVLIGWSGAALLWIFLTRFFDRMRPEAQMGIVVHDPSFPSGHTTQAVLCFGMLAYFLIPRMPSVFWKWVIALAAIATMVFIGYSRFMQGGHYFTDLIAGYALGIAWAGLIYTWMDSYVNRRRGTRG